MGPCVFDFVFSSTTVAIPLCDPHVRCLFASRRGTSNTPRRARARACHALEHSLHRADLLGIVRAWGRLSARSTRITSFEAIACA